MSKLTIEQIKKINNGCSNGFSFDRSYFLFHSEKTLKKNIYLDEKDVDGNEQCINAHLYYFPEYEEYTNCHGVKCNKKTGLFVPTLRLSFCLSSLNSLPVRTIRQLCCFSTAPFFSLLPFANMLITLAMLLPLFNIQPLTLRQLFSLFLAFFNISLP